MGEGMNVRCVVVEKRKKYLECLVLGRYYMKAKIKKYKNGGMEEGIEVGHSVKVEVSKVSFAEDKPVMVGEFLKEEEEEATIDFVEFEGGIPVGEDIGLESACSGNSLKRKLEEEEDDSKKAARKRRKEEKRRLREIKRKADDIDNELSLSSLCETSLERKADSKEKENVGISSGVETEMLLADENKAIPREKGRGPESMLSGVQTGNENKVKQNEKKKKHKENVKASPNAKLVRNEKDDDKRDYEKSKETEETHDGLNQEKEAIGGNILGDKDINIDKKLPRREKEK